MFAGHCFEDGRFFPVNGKVAGLFVGGNSRVTPLAFFDGFAVFSTAGYYFPGSLTNIFFSAGAGKHVDALLLVWVFFAFAVCTEDVSQLSAALESDIESGFFGSTFEGIRDRWDVWEADEGFLFHL